MEGRLAVDVGTTTIVAVIQREGDEAARPLRFDGEDGPPGTLAASLTWSSSGAGRAGIEADRVLDLEPLRGVRGPLAHLESGSSTFETEHGPVPVVALVAELLARPLRLTTIELGAPPAAVVLTIPAGWPPDGRRARALRAAAALAGMPRVTLVPAAIAAAEHLRGDDGATIVLVCDVGGRSCQISLVDLRDAPGRLLATTELVAGADLFDELLYLDVLRELVDRDEDAAQRLEDVHLHAGAPSAGSADAEWAACQADLARAIRHAREDLTTAATHELVIGDPVGITIELEQHRIRDLVLTESLVVAAAAREQLAQADLASTRSEDVRVLLAGGGALTPGLREVIAAELDVPVLLADDPVTAVARGALAATRPLAAERPAQPPARVRATPRPAPIRQTLRTVLEDVVAATMIGDEVVAIVRHDSHHRVVRIDLRGRVAAAHGVDGDHIGAISATPGAIVVSGPSGAAIFSAGLHPLTRIARPLLAAASWAIVWVVAAGDEQAPVLNLTTLAVEGRKAEVVAVDRLGLASSAGVVRLPRRGSRPAPPAAHGTVAGVRLHFASPARGRGGQPAQVVGAATPSGLADSELRGGPGWTAAVAPSAGGVVTVAGPGTARVLLGDEELAAWPAGVRVRLAAHGSGAPWVVAGRQTRWEALRVDGPQLAKVRAGDGTVERASADADGLWLVCESGGERRLVRVSAAGELDRVAAIGAPMEPLGRAGDETLVLAGAPAAPRTLVAIAAG